MKVNRALLTRLPVALTVLAAIGLSVPTADGLSGNESRTTQVAMAQLDAHRLPVICPSCVLCSQTPLPGCP